VTVRLPALHSKYVYPLAARSVCAEDVSCTQPPRSDTGSSPSFCEAADSRSSTTATNTKVDIAYSRRRAIDPHVLQALFADAWEGHGKRDYTSVLDRSFTWITHMTASASCSHDRCFRPCRAPGLWGQSVTRSGRPPSACFEVLGHRRRRTRHHRAGTWETDKRNYDRWIGARRGAASRSA
jgi:hypothetical protein